MIRIEFPTLTLFGGSVEPLHGFFIKDGGLAGLEDLPDARDQTSERPNSHGSFDLPVFRGMRLVSISGWAIAPSQLELGNMRDRLVGLGSSSKPVPFSLDDGTRTLTTQGRIISCKMPRHGREHYLRWAAFALSVECRDPRLYGEGRTHVGSWVPVFHQGNDHAYPIVEVAGPRAAPYTITGPAGRSVTVTQALSAGQAHRIDFRSGRVYRNDTLQVGALGRADVWTIPPGQQVPMSISSGSMTVTVTDTYM